MFLVNPFFLVYFLKRRNFQPPTYFLNDATELIAAGQLKLSSTYNIWKPEFKAKARVILLGIPI